MREKNNRTQWLHLRLMPEEYSRIQEKFKKTTCRKLSEYARKVLLDKPLTTTYRNQSMDDFMEEVVRLRADLHGISNNFNQVVKRLHIINVIADYKSWLLAWEQDREILLSSIDEIKSSINKMAEKWLQ